ncbi:unnamed protein product [Rhizophagus irregularis]|nr:unnamed protein product [Rhizophagus irregularis]
MSALVLQNNALWHIFEDFTPSILLSAFFLIYVIRNKFSNDLPSRDNKIANELSARISEINVNLTAEIEKNKACGGSITAEIEKTFIEMNKKFSTEVSTKIANKFSTRLFEVNFTFTVELVRNNNELNKKLTGKIAKINSHDAGYVSEAQKILSMVNDLEEDCRNDFGNISSEFNSIRASIEALQNEMIQCYAIAQRLQVEFDQLSVANHSSSSESSSSRLSDSSLEENRNRFKRVFNLVKEVGDTMDYAFETVRREIRQLTGEKIGKETVKNFYYGEGDPKFRIVMSIMRWVDSKE